jgi:hypothetical protein
MIQFMSAVSNAKIEAVKLENFVIAKALKTVLNDAKSVNMTSNLHQGQLKDIEITNDEAKIYPRGRLRRRSNV